MDPPVKILVKWVELQVLSYALKDILVKIKNVFDFLRMDIRFWE